MTKYFCESCGRDLDGRPGRCPGCGLMLRYRHSRTAGRANVKAVPGYECPHDSTYYPEKGVERCSNCGETL